MNLQNYYDFDKLKSKSSTIKKIFFYRICGTGMGAAACLLKEAGFEVSGTDRMFYPPMSTYLEKSGIPVQKMDSLCLEDIRKEFDLIVVGNVVARQSDDAREIEELGIPFCSFPAAIGAFVLENKKVIGLSGTHGKTTTTYMGLQLFENLGQKAGYLIGGVLDNRPSASCGESKYFFIESDEYDSAYFEKYSKFQSYSINSLVVTSLEFDHADIFASIDDIKHEFSNLIPKVDYVVGCSDWPYIEDLKNFFSTKGWYSYGKKNISILKEGESGTSFRMSYEKKELEFSTNVVGEHNILNLSSVIIIALNEGYTPKDIQSSIQNMEMVQRRQEVKGSINKSPVIDDFAHHPTAVLETLKAIKTKYPGKDINVYLEPGSATARSDIFQNQFAESLGVATTVVIIRPSRPTTAIGHGDMDIDALVSQLNSSDIRSLALNDLDKLIIEIKNNANENTVQLIMSNSSCLGLWSSDFADSL